MAIHKILGAHLSASMHFVLHFDRKPDFKTLDSVGRQADAFQIFIAFDPTTPNPEGPSTVDVLIRGEEIHLSKDIRVRDARPSISDPSADGWGALRGSVPYALHVEKDKTAILMFDIPFPLLGVMGKFAYAVMITHFGAAVDEVRGVAP
jgi:hypothetical protein